MGQNEKNGNFVESLQYLYEDIFEIQIQKEQVYVWSSRQNPDLNGRTLPYNMAREVIGHERVYHLDAEKFQKETEPDGMRRLLAQKDPIQFDVRCKAKGEFPFCWKQISLIPVSEESLMVYVRDIETEKQQDIMNRAVMGDYDYIMYLDAGSDHYYVYTNEQENLQGKLPRKKEGCYSEGMSYFTEHYLSERDRERAQKVLELQNIRKQLKQKKELIFYGDVHMRDQILHKKIRVICYDREREVYLLTRSDITGAVEKERRKKESVMEAFQAAEAADQTKDAFLSKISNEVRNPVGTIIGSAALAATHLEDKSRAVDSLNKISQAGRHLLKIMNQMLDVSAMGEKKSSEERFWISEVMDLVLQQLQKEVEEQHHELIFHMQGLEHEEVYGNPEDLQKACYNIVNNAVHFTPPHGRIHITLREFPSRVTGYGYYELEVVDNGEGIDPEIQKNVFQPFIQRGKQNEGSGMGLGLTLAKAAVSRMHGKIRLDSTPGEGTSVLAGFYLRQTEEEPRWKQEYQGRVVLLLASSREGTKITKELENAGVVVDLASNLLEAQRRMEYRNVERTEYFAVFVTAEFPEETEGTIQCLKAWFTKKDHPLVWIQKQTGTQNEKVLRKLGYTHVLYQERLAHTLTKLFQECIQMEEEQEYMCTEQLEEIDLSGKKVLLSESNQFNREIMEEMLGMTGLAVDTMVDGEMALERIAHSREGAYDLLILEVSVQNAESYEIPKRIRQLPRQDVKKMPIFALASDLRLEGLVRVKKAGMDEYLLKPVSLSDMAGKLQKWLLKQEERY